MFRRASSNTSARALEPEVGATGLESEEFNAAMRAKFGDWWAGESRA